MVKAVLEKFRSTPTDPGVYLMMDKSGTIIYVGKAGNLRKRLASYFTRESGHDLKTALLIKKIRDFKLMVTSTEHEALILESTLIKKHRPRYNVVLKDGKNYPCLKIDTAQPFPALEVVRKIKNDGALYFGPYSSAYSVRSTLKQVNRIFRLRKCKKNQFKNRSRPCLNFQIKSCLGLCCNAVTKDSYAEIINDVVLFLKGRAPELIRRLKKEMKDAASLERFEKAAQLRDTIFAVEKILEKQVAVTADRGDRDVIVAAGDRGKAIVTLLFVRSGNLVGSRHYPFEMEIATLPEILNAFIKQYYSNQLFIPDQVLISHAIEDSALLETEITLKKGKKVSLRVPVRGEKKRIIEMALLNAVTELKSLLSKESEIREILLSLQKMLRMDNYPGRIECFDNSNIAGTDPVSAMAVFTRGVPDKGQYRKYIIKTVPRHDDYAYMTEVLRRRFNNKKSSTVLPDLLMVDGGKGQLSMALAVVDSLGLTGQFQIIGLAKKDPEKGEADDKIYLPGRSNPVNINQGKKALFLLQRLRNEAHRFAITFQRKRRSKRGSASILDTVPGIGNKRKKVLLKTYKGITRMKKADTDELAALPGMTRQAAEALAKALRTV